MLYIYLLNNVSMIWRQCIEIPSVFSINSKMPIVNDIKIIFLFYKKNSELLLIHAMVAIDDTFQWILFKSILLRHICVINNLIPAMQLKDINLQLYQAQDMASILIYILIKFCEFTQLLCRLKTMLLVIALKYFFIPCDLSKKITLIRLNVFFEVC